MKWPWQRRRREEIDAEAKWELQIRERVSQRAEAATMLRDFIVVIDKRGQVRLKDPKLSAAKLDAFMRRAIGDGLPTASDYRSGNVVRQV